MLTFKPKGYDEAHTEPIKSPTTASFHSDLVNDDIGWTEECEDYKHIAYCVNSFSTLA